MKSNALFASFLVLSALTDLGCNHKKPDGPGLTVLTYASLGGKGGFLESVRDDFLKTTGCELRLETTLGATQVISYLEEEKSRARVDVVMGMDEFLFERSKSYIYQGDFSEHQLKEKLLPLIGSHAKAGFIPVDYGALSFIYRKSDFKGATLPSHLPDFLKPELKKKWIVQDPRASSPGLLFFLFTLSEGIRPKSLKHQWVTLAPSWESSYKMFLAKDSSMVWSYLSSLAYHASKGEADQYGYIDFKEGLPLQVEGMAILNRVGDPRKSNPCISKWIDYVLEPVNQAKLVAKQWMMPAVKNVAMPELFKNLPVVKKSADVNISIDTVNELVSHFGREIQDE